MSSKEYATKQDMEKDPKVRDKAFMFGAIAKMDLDRHKYGSTNTDEFVTFVKIKSAKTSFGRLDFLVEPIAGIGERWVSSANVTIVDARNEVAIAKTKKTK